MTDDRATRLFKDEYERAKGYRAEIEALREQLREAQRENKQHLEVAQYAVRDMKEGRKQVRRLTDALRDAKEYIASLTPDEYSAVALAKVCRALAPTAGEAAALAEIEGESDD